MARIDLGLGVAGIIGTEADATFYKWRGIQCVRTCNHSPKPTLDPPHLLARASMTVLVNVWKHLPAVWKAAWNTFAARLQMSGFNCFVKANGFDQYTDTWLSAAPSNPRVFPVVSIAAVDAGAQKVTVTWLGGDAVPTDKVEIMVIKDYHPINKAAVVEDNGRPVFTETGTTLVSALTKASMATGAGDFLVAVAVKKTATGELSICGVKKVTVA